MRVEASSAHNCFGALAQQSLFPLPSKLQLEQESPYRYLELELNASVDDVFLNTVWMRARWRPALRSLWMLATPFWFSLGSQVDTRCFCWMWVFSASAMENSGLSRVYRGYESERTSDGCNSTTCWVRRSSGLVPDAFIASNATVLKTWLFSHRI